MVQMQVPARVRHHPHHIEVAEDGRSFTGTFTLEFPAAMGDAIGTPLGQLGPGEVTGSTSPSSRWASRSAR